MYRRPQLPALRVGSAVVVTAVLALVAGALLLQPATKVRANGVNEPAAILSPTNNTILVGPTVTFTRDSGTNGFRFYLWIDDSADFGSLLAGYQMTTSSLDVGGLPGDARVLHVRLITEFIDGTFGSQDYVYRSPTNTASDIISPADGSTLPGASATFTRNTTDNVVLNRLKVGTGGPGSSNIANTLLISTSALVNGLPTGGQTVYVRLESEFADGGSAFKDYTYTAFQTFTAAEILSPEEAPTEVPLGVGNSITVTRSQGTGAALYAIWIDNNSDFSSLIAGYYMPGTSIVIPNLQAGGLYYLRLFTQFTDGTWAWDDRAVVIYDRDPGRITGPLPTELPLGDTTFTWEPGECVSLACDTGSDVNGVSSYVLTIVVGIVSDVSVWGANETSATIDMSPWAGLGPVTVTLTTTFGDTTIFNDVKTYTVLTKIKALLIAPQDGTQLVLHENGTVGFSRGFGQGAVAYAIWIDDSADFSSLLAGYFMPSTTIFVGGLPTNGTTLYVRLLTQFSDGTWQFQDYVFTAPGGV